MDSNHDTEHAIAQLMTSTCGAATSIRDKHVFRESLRALVRLAKAEQMLEIRKNIERLTTMPCAKAVH